MVRFPSSINHNFSVIRQTAIQPPYLITNFKACILNSTGHTVISTCAGKCKQVSARFKHPKDFLPHIHVVGNAAAVPRFTHEAKLVWRISDARISTFVRQLLHFDFALAMYQFVIHQSSLLTQRINSAMSVASSPASNCWRRTCAASIGLRGRLINSVQS